MYALFLVAVALCSSPSAGVAHVDTLRRMERLSHRRMYAASYAAG